MQTVDFFTPIVDEPISWGRIAAANSLSDVYAMGGVPLTALNLVGWPRELDFDLLGAVLRGAGEVCARARVAIVGGHSIDDCEPKFGLAVTGTVAPEAVVTTAGAPPGAELVLTKPLGTGIISSGIKGGDSPPDAVAAAVASMEGLNDAASRAMVEAGAAAATDVTGFGLLGHLTEMLGQSLDAHLEAGAVPLLPGALSLARRGVMPGGTRRNIAAGRDRVTAEGLQPGLRELLFDAQTSGGLLVALEASRSAGFLAALEASGVTAARIGRLEAGTGRIVVTP